MRGSFGRLDLGAEGYAEQQFMAEDVNQSDSNGMRSHSPSE